MTRERAVAVQDELEALLRSTPFFHDLEPVELARLVGALEEVHLPAGATVFEEGANADALYLLAEGRVAVTVRALTGERTLAELVAPAHFGELGLFLARRTGSAKAMSDVTLWKLPRDRFEQLLRERLAIGVAVAASLAELMDRRSREHAGAPLVRYATSALVLERPTVTRPLRWRIAGLALALGVPLALWLLDAPGGLSQDGWHVLLIVAGAALAWLFEPVPDYVVTLAMAAAWGIAGLVPISLAFGGFASSSWALAVGALALAAAMARSGLLFRIALLALQTFPRTHAGQVAALLAGGLLTTPLVPLAVARVATVAPLSREIARALGYAAQSRAQAALAFAGLIGYGSFSSVFLTGLAMNFFILDLVPAPDRARFGWLQWLVAAAPVGVVVLAGAVVVLLALFRPEVPPKATADILRRQERILGPPSRRELVTIVAVSVLLLGLLLQPLIRVDAAWLALASLALAVAGGGLDRERFRGSIDWGFLLLFGVLLGTGGVLHSAGVDRWIGALLVPVAHAVGDPGLLAVALAAFVVACRLAIPWIPATLLLSLALVPVAPQLGLTPWVVGLIILVAANTWIHPSQSDFCRLTREATGGVMFTERQGIVAGVAMTAVTLAAIAASVPYWRAMGVLTP